MDIDREHFAQLRDLMLRALSHDNNVRREGWVIEFLFL